MKSAVNISHLFMSNSICIGDIVIDATAEIRPVSAAGAPVARPLDAAPAPVSVAPAAPAAVPPAPTFSPDTDQLKRSPKGGKLPYSEENLARLKAAETAPASVPVPAPVPVVPAVAATPAVASAPVPPATPAPTPVAAPAAATAGDLGWAWPLPGKPIATFGDSNKGLDFAGKIGDAVLAAAPGKVIHVGNEIRGLGNFVVVKHNAEFLSVYANNSRILVKQDQQVARGQKIAELGNSDADQPKLHFEIRQQGKPVDPLKYLPPR